MMYFAIRSDGAPLYRWAYLACAMLTLGSVGCLHNDESDINSNLNGTNGHGALMGVVISQGDEEYDSDESSMADVTVYLDANDNGVLDPGERATKTNWLGMYLFTGLPQGDYIVRQQVPFGWRNVEVGDGPEAPAATVLSRARPHSARIIGGAETEPSEYPFMVAVGAVFGDEFSAFCGGVLITDRWIATAAHCSTDQNVQSAAVVVGTNNVEDGSGQRLEIERIYWHPTYDAVTDLGILKGYDIALWQLKTPVALGQSGLQTLAMLSAENRELAVAGTLATAVGWGYSDLPSKLLQDVHLPVFDDDACARAYPEASNIDTQICAGAPEGGIDPCQGDSGGPLLVRDAERERWMLAGVTSYGRGCALPGYPGVSARVSALVDWIEATAVEPSRAHRLHVVADTWTFASFANVPTRYQPGRSIEPRWQLTELTTTTGAQGGMVAEWRILKDDEDDEADIRCTLDPDGTGPLAGLDVACEEGWNRADFPGFSTGLYLPTLTASRRETTFRRDRTAVVGTPSQVSVDGELTANDPLDPDSRLPIPIDYFDVAGLSYSKAISIQVESDSLVAVYLYDRDARQAGGGGGLLATFPEAVPGTPIEYAFFPTPGVNYAIGVSAFAPNGNKYKVTVVNEGAPIATSF